MRSERRNRWDLLAAIAAGIALSMIGVYATLMGQQGDQVVIWFLAGLTVAAFLSIYGVARTAPRRRLALTVSGVTMVGFGIVSILSLGFPILVAGALSLVAAARDDKRAPEKSMV